MNGRRCVAAVGTCIVAALVCVERVGGQENDGAAAPARFRDLLRPGQEVLLHTSADHPLYTMQLLSDEQTKEVEAYAAKEAEATQRMKSIQETLQKDQSLEQRATLIKERQDLSAASFPLSRQRASMGSPYRVTHVGEDYVAATAGTTELFIPFRSIRYLRRSDTVLPRFPELPVRVRSFQQAPPGQVTSRIELRKADAAEVVAIIEKLYADTGVTITVDVERHALLLQAPSGATLRNIEELVRSLEQSLEAAAQRKVGTP